MIKTMVDTFEDIPGYEGRYQINKTTGQIKSNTNWAKGQILEIFTNRQGDKRVNLCLAGKVKQYRLEDLLNGNT